MLYSAKWWRVFFNNTVIYRKFWIDEKSFSMSKIYDAAYKLFFSNQTLFRQLLETFVEQDWVK